MSLYWSCTLLLEPPVVMHSCSYMTPPKIIKVSRVFLGVRGEYCVTAISTCTPFQGSMSFEGVEHRWITAQLVLGLFSVCLPPPHFAYFRSKSGVC